jgi:mannitol-1-/sugar-/sorbitol-6-phosphatase
MGELPAVALLLDLDGTLIQAVGSWDQHWADWADRHGLPRDEVVTASHDGPAQAVVARFLRDSDVAAEVAWVERLDRFREVESALPGAAEVLAQRDLPVAIVTSAAHDTAVLRLQRAGLPEPPVLVAGDRVRHGKPHPEPYLVAARRLGVDPAGCVGVDDTPSGIAALRAAGVAAVAVLTTRDAADLADADLTVPDLAALQVVPGGVRWVAGA